jgi:hypothetical protein
MRITSCLLALVAALIGYGCADEPHFEHAPKTTYVAHGQTYCAIHRIPLVPRRMFTSRVMLIHYGDERCAECGERFPNEIGPGFARHPMSLYRDAWTVWYCPICEQAFRKCVAGSPCESDLTKR